jgi:Saxitoxin biosynthesis operon protein SxtJ
MLSDTNSSPIPTERSFGLSVGLACLALAGIAWWRSHNQVFPVLAIIGGVLLAGGIAAPPLLRIPNRLWWRFAQILGWVNARLILTVSFIVVLTPIGFLLRLFGRSPLKAPDGKSTWSAYRSDRRGPTHYEHLF